LADGREQGLAEGRQSGRSEGLVQGQEQGKNEGHARGFVEGLEQGKAEGHARGYVEGLEQGKAESHARGLVEGRSQGLVEGREEGFAEGREQGLAEGREQGLIDGRVLGIAAPREDAAGDPRAEAELADAFRAIDGARSLSEILDTLTTSVGRQASRVAVLLVRGPELRAWRSVGLGSADLSSLHLDTAGIVRDAVRTQSTASADRSSNGDRSTPAFAAARPAQDRLAVPLIVGGEVVAVVYADQADGDVGSRLAPAASWRTTIELVTRHAARSLEAVTAFRAAQLYVDPGAVARVPATRHDG
jgi:hypothetical protein